MNYGQGIDNIWLLGYDTIGQQFTGRSIISFSGASSPSINLSFQHPLSFWRTATTISDGSGNLLFYTNGFDVCNRQGDIMPNGHRIDTSAVFNLDSIWYKDGMPISQGALILNAPGKDSLYYLFHETVQPYFIDSSGALAFYSKDLLYSIIDLQSDGGMGDLAIREQSALFDTLSLGRITAARHANGRDWWILVYRYAGDAYITLLLSPSGLSTPTYQSLGSRMDYCDLGQAVFNPQGDKYAFADKSNGLVLMDFDRCTGILSNQVHILLNDTAAARGLSFSPNGRYLYVSGIKILYQFDTWASNIESTKDTVAIWDGSFSSHYPFATTFYLMQLASDGKIYINSSNGVKILHTINNPDSGGIACDVCQHCVQLPTYNAVALPNHPNYFLGADSGSICDTLQLGIKNPESRMRLETISVYPNPVQDYLQVNYIPNEEVKTLQIFDINSKIVLERKLPQYSQLTKIDVTKFVQGIYLCKLTYRNKMLTCKFVKE